MDSALSAFEYLERRAAEVNAYLPRCVPDETTPPTNLHRAMRYSLLGGGKRLRPVLALAAAEACGGKVETILPVACALEMVHTYSLVHDDLPSMDNDDLRRGRPTNHKVFGEATAILVGDALLTHAFMVLAEAKLPGGTRAQLVRELAVAAGAAGGMVGGQAEDLAHEGAPATIEIVERIHRAKTGAMIQASVVMGGIAAVAEPPLLAALRTYGDAIGLAFQIVDDLLDLSSTSEELGKTAGKDLSANKATFPAVLGVEESTRRAKDLLEKAVAALAPFGTESRRLEQIARFVVERRA